MLRLFPRLLFVFLCLSALGMISSLVLSRFSPETKVLTFSTTQLSPLLRLYLHDTAQRISVPIVLQHSYSNYQPHWTPSGERMLYSLTDPAGNSLLMQWSRRNGNHHQIYPDAQNVEAPSAGMNLITLWDIKDLQTVVTLNHSLTYDLFQIDLKNLEVNALKTQAINDNASYCITPEGRLRFVQRGKNDHQIKLYEYQENEPVLLQTWRMRFSILHDAEFAPDCERFLIPGMTSESLNFELYLFDLNTDEIANVSKRAQHNDSNPAWSHDGQSIAFTSVNNAGYFVILSSIDGEEQRVLYRFDAVTAVLDWSPDDLYLSVLFKNTTEAQLCLIELKTDALDCSLSARDINDVSWQPEM